jgi:hypothetical protein
LKELAAPHLASKIALPPPGPGGGIPSGTHFNAWSIDLPYATPGNDNRKVGGTGAIGDGTEFVIP